MSAIIRVGDWISGTSPQDEKFIGYVESINEGVGSVKAWVTQCDREDAVGTALETKLSKAKKLPEQSPSTPEELRSLIELSLQTHDKTWFASLSESLAALTAANEGNGETKLHFSSTPSRLARNNIFP